MMLVGLIWAVFAPLLLVPIVLGIAFLMRRLGWARALPLAAVVVLAPIAAIYWTDRTAFSNICDQIGEPVIAARTSADGIYLNSPTATSFGTRYLQDEGFDWIERRDLYNRDNFLHVSRNADGTLIERRVAAPSARYEVVEAFEQREPDAGISWIKVIDRQTGTEMARAASATFGGGRMGWVLGAHGVADCPDAMTAPESFDRYYHLARYTLRPDEG
jgi:hypothetical protein